MGEISADQAKQGNFFYDNAAMGIHLNEFSRQYGVENFIGFGIIYAYSKFTPVSLKEDDLWSGYPEETNTSYRLAKKMILVQAYAYRKQYGLNATYLLSVNLYGPGDNLDSYSSHVIPAHAKKCIMAKNR